MIQSETFSEAIDRLPVAAAFKELAAALNRQAAAVLVAPPGAGKTTAVPLALLQADWLGGRRILLLAPRRLAARAAAFRMAALLCEPVGETVGYRIRLETRVGPSTRIEVITEGVLTRMLQSDPGLPGVGLVIFDEFHERSLDADLGLALCRQVQTIFNRTLRLLVMSATLDPAPVADLLGQAPLIRCEGRTFPVETRYAPFARTQPVERAVANTLLRSAAAQEGNILAFLPGAPEIRRVVRLLATSCLADCWDVAPLYGSLTRAAQEAAIGPPQKGRAKIVLATAIAETSLTIEQIRVVVDSGLQRSPRFDPRAGLTRLATSPVSRASADQRCGRAGRTQPGICYRLWSQDVHSTLAPFNRPEMLDADLTGLALELAIWGESTPAELSWLNPPPMGAFEQARHLLSDLGALDEQGRITAHGRAMAELPAPPRLAHMILAAAREGMGAAACQVAAIIGERDPLDFMPERRDADLRLRLDLLQAFQNRRSMAIPDGSVNQDGMRRILTVAAGLQRRLVKMNQLATPTDPGRLLAWAYPDRIASRRPDGMGRYLMTNGRGARFSRPEPLAVHDLLVIAELDGKHRDARIFLAAAYDRRNLEEQYGSRMQSQASVTWDAHRQAVSAERRLTLGALTLRNEPLKNPDSRDVAAAMIAGIRQIGAAALPWTPGLRNWQARVMLLRTLAAGEEQWPDVSDDALLTELENWLAPWLEGVTSIKTLARLDLRSALQERLSRRQRLLLDDWAPTHLTVPSGSRRPIDYSADPPVLAVRLQEMFGSAQTPAIAAGRVPLLLHLLSPAGRPTQITRDLAGFWQNSYPAVRKELKGRYPKHEWPADPLKAQATSKARPRNK